MNARLLSMLRSERSQHVSETARRNEAIRWAVGGYYADRFLLVFSLFWLGLRLHRHIRLSRLPDAFFEPLSWLGKIIFAAGIDVVWYLAFAAGVVCVVISLRRPSIVLVRAMMALAFLVLMSRELAYGHLEHPNHLFLLAHVFAIFIPFSKSAEKDLFARSRMMRWYTAGVVFTYFLAGAWKVLDLTVFRLIRDSMTWVHPDALAIASAHEYRTVDLPMDVPSVMSLISPIGGAGYLMIALVFATSLLAVWRRPLLPLVLLMIIIFHVMNAVALYVRFLITCVVAIVLFFPWDAVVPAVRLRLAPVAGSFYGIIDGRRLYRRVYECGDEDRFIGFSAVRERLRDLYGYRTAPLYFPGVRLIADSFSAWRRRNHAAVK